MSESEWTEALTWAKALAEFMDLDAEERDYKLVMAAALAEARQRVEDRAESWPKDIQRGLTKGNFINQFVMMRFIEEMRDRPEETRSLLLDLLDSADHVQAIGRFVAAMQPRHSAFSTGNSITLASALLIAVDPTQFPPYRTEAVHKFLDLVGLPRPDQGDPAARYQSMLDALDGLLERAPEAGIVLRDRLDAQGLAWTLVKEDPPATWDATTRLEFRRWRGDKVIEIDYQRGVGKSQAIEDAAWAVMGPGLRGEPSVLDPSVHTWRAETARELHRRVMGGDAASKDSFLIKLERQLAGASRDVVLLAAELLYLHVVPLDNITPPTKLHRIRTVLDWSEPPASLPEHLVHGLEAQGVFTGGAGFSVPIWQQLLWLCRFVEHWALAAPTEREAALDDPWAFRRLIAGTPQDWPSIRLSMQYLAWPGYFENIVNRDHRRAVHNAFAGVIGGVSGSDDEAIDRDLHAIRNTLEAGTEGRIEWYVSPYAEQWRKDSSTGQRAWLVRPQPAGALLVTQWKSERIISLPAKHLGDVPPGATLPRIHDAVEAGYEHLDYAQRLSVTSEFYAFLTKMQTDDIVATVADGALSVGVVLDEPVYVDDAATRLRRSVQWSQAAVALDDLDVSLRSLLDRQGAVVDLTTGLDLLASLATAGASLVEESEAPLVPDVPGEVPALAPVTEALATRLYLPAAALQEWVDLLQSRQQLVFYGPPGTGKTYLARELANHLVGADNPSRVQLVQFHPSYSYEDFFEGFRPCPTPSGQPSFRVTPGALRRLAGEAAKPENRGQPFVLIVDEMNRANIAKVFGELYFLLEYRRASVWLQYTPDESFGLPKNLFIIGTMNTADRSIALVDAAIRRRFPFVELHPDRSPIEGLLRAFLAACGHDFERAELLAALNAEIEDRDLHVGPSYLMRPEAETAQGLARIWEYDILPLLTEHYYGRLSPEETRRRFGLDAIRARARRVVDVVPAREGMPLVDLGEEPGA